MPAAVSAWLTHENIYYCQDVLDYLVNTYRQDIEKYAKSSQVEYVRLLFDRVPEQLGKKFVYSRLCDEATVYQVKQALGLLSKAGIIHFCHHTSGQGHPLGADKNIRKFKIFFFDIGLARRVLGLEAKDWLMETVLPQHNGAVAEQFVAQELMAHSRPAAPGELYYWHREAKSSQAEVDFVIVRNGKVVPIEVKSGKRGHLKSMKYFLGSHPNSEKGIKLAAFENRQFDYFEQIPFYDIERVVT